MKASHPAQIPDLWFNPRFMTQWIPVRLRGVLLLVGTIIFFPLIVAAIMFDAVTHDMPQVRAPLKKVLLAIADCVRMGSRMMRTKRVSASSPFGGMVQEQTSMAS